MVGTRKSTACMPTLISVVSFRTGVFIPYLFRICSSQKEELLTNISIAGTGGKKVLLKSHNSQDVVFQYGSSWLYRS